MHTQKKGGEGACNVFNMQRGITMFIPGNMSFFRKQLHSCINIILTCEEYQNISWRFLQENNFMHE